MSRTLDNPEFNNPDPQLLRIARSARFSRQSEREIDRKHEPRIYGTLESRVARCKQIRRFRIAIASRSTSVTVHQKRIGRSSSVERGLAIAIIRRDESERASRIPVRGQP